MNVLNKISLLDFIKRGTACESFNGAKYQDIALVNDWFNFGGK